MRESVVVARRSNLPPRALHPEKSSPFPEDELVYTVAHAWKHSRNNGTGIRVVADIIVTVTTAKAFD